MEGLCDSATADANASTEVAVAQACIMLFNGNKSRVMEGRRGVGLLQKVVREGSSEGGTTYITALNTLADFFESARIPARARELYKMHLKTVDDKDPDIRTKLGVIELRSEHTTEARQEFEVVLKYNPHHKRANAYLGLILKLEGKLEEAVTRMKVGQSRS